MKFRWKLLILLLSISIVPIAVSRLFGAYAVRKMGDKLVAQAQTRIMADTESRLRLLVDAYSLILWKQRDQVETVLRMQAAEVQRALGQKGRIPDKVFYAEDFNHGRDLPADTFSSERHVKTNRQGGRELLKVSYAQQVFKLAPGIAFEQVADDIARLAPLTPVYQRLHTHVEKEALWQYTVLDTGLHSAYPGHNGIPKKLDFRDQPWYRQAKTGQVPWTNPYIDPETRQIVIAAAMPVTIAGRDPAGVTAIVVPIGPLLDQPLLVRNIPGKSSAFLCYIETRPETGQRGARIVARQDRSTTRHRNWQTQLGTEWLVSKNEPQFQAMLDDVAAGTGNLRRMSHRDCSCIWAYGPVQNGAFVVVIIPEAEVLAPARASEHFVQNLIDGLIRITRYGLIGVILLIAGVALAFSRTVTRPLQTLVDGAMRLAEGRFDTRVDIRSRDEFGEMGRVFNAVVPRMEEHYRMSRSMASAREVQQSLLPKSCPFVPGLDIHGAAISCDETGGDYFDFLTIGRRDRGRIGIVVGDVSGHGLPAALLMASARAYLRQRASMPGRISDMVGDVNRRLALDVEESGRFMTLFFGEVDRKNQAVSWVRAGHDPGLLYDPANDTFTDLGGGGPALGIVDDADFPESSRSVSIGQVMVIGTDGIWETHNGRGEMFGKGRLREVIRANAWAAASTILEKTIDALHTFRQGAVQEDDITLVVIKITDDRSPR